jgi:hypothetical protein
MRHHLSALGLPDSEGEAVPSGRSVAASKAAEVRWLKEKEKKR